MDLIFLHLFKKDPYSLSLFLGTISREPFTEIQPWLCSAPDKG